MKIKLARGGLRLKWIDGVGEDLNKLGIKGWQMTARNRESWQEDLE